jgi:putative flippase GtrA
VLSVIARYLAVGGLVSFTYIALTTMMIEILGMTALVGSIMGFGANLPIAYAGHYYITFQSSGKHSKQGPRFLLTAATSFLVSSLAVIVVTELLEWHYSIALALTTLLIPVINFTVFRLWVFRSC